MFLSAKGPMLETLDFAIRHNKTPTFLYFDLLSYLSFYSIRPVPFKVSMKWKIIFEHYIRHQAPIECWISSKIDKPWPNLIAYSSKIMHQIYLKFSVNVPAMVLCSNPLTNCSLHRHFNRIVHGSNLGTVPNSSGTVVLSPFTRHNFFLTIVILMYVI